jgi:hypothetical protein
VAPTEPPATEDAPAPRARRQLGRVLLLLGLLDLTVLVFVIGVILAAGRWGLSPIELLMTILLGAGTVVGARVWLAVRLRRRSGELF